jgi:predicted nucleotidyltransferase
MSSSAAAWRILRPSHEGVSLVRYYYDDDEKRALQVRKQREFAKKLAGFMQDNGYTATIHGPRGVGDINVKPKEVDAT